MSVLVTTLRQDLAHADKAFDSGRIVPARRAFEKLLEKAQERTDRSMEVIARSMIARTYLRARNVDEAQTQLLAAARFIDPLHMESHSRYRSTLARLALESGPPLVARQELLDYLRWAEEERADALVLDACMLLAPGSAPSERVDWLERGIEHALSAGVHSGLGRAYNDLGAALDQVGRPEDALEAYKQALVWHLNEAESMERQPARAVIGSTWAVGSLACRLEDWPLARERLEEAIEAAESTEDCGDLLALSLADLAHVYEAAGDVVEARRLSIRALGLAREEELQQIWPKRWDALAEHAKHLEVYTDR